MRIFVALMIFSLVAGSILVTAHAQTAPTEETLRTLIENALKQYLDPSSTVSVSVGGVTESAGVVTVDSVVLNADPAVIRGVQAEVLLYMTSVEFEPGAAAGTGVGTQLRLRRVGGAMIVASTTAASVRDALAGQFPIIQDATIKFDAGQFIVTGKLRDGGQPAMLRGRFIVERGVMVRAMVLEATVGGSPIPPQLVEAQLARFNPVLDLSGSPIPIRVKVLALHNDRIEILAGTD
jgi:hypothetical protein